MNAFARAEVDSPNEDRMLHAFKHPDMGPILVTFLPRYRSPALAEPTRKLVRDGSNPMVQAGAISGLIGMLDHTEKTRVFVRGLLKATHPVTRGRAAEYLCWFGVAEDYPFLMKGSTGERDPHARAAMIEAAAAIKRRATLFPDGPVSGFQPSAEPVAIYRNLAAVLAEKPTEATRQAAIARLRGAERIEPVVRYPDKLDHEERGGVLFTLHRLVTGYPEEAKAIEPSVPTPAESVMPPVRDFFDPTRKSYGILIQPGQNQAWAGKHHVGDDCAWRQDHETVVAIGDGVVRRVELGQRSWGGWVVVEHRDRQGRGFCSLYGHLGPLICVRPGEVVRKGTKIGAVGLSYSYANGGYLAHLHFGIHRGAYLCPDHVGERVTLSDESGDDVTALVTEVQEFRVKARLPDGRIRILDRSARWTTGYISPKEFSDRNSAWVNPQGFLQGYGP